MDRVARASDMALVVLGAVIGLSGQSADVRATFDAADVHLRPHSVSAIPSMTAPMLRGSRYDIRNATMLDLIKIAYGVDKERVLGGPNWLDWDRFDIVARAAAATPSVTISRMLQTLLAERFALVVHRDTKALPGFALAVAATKPKLKATSGQGSAGCDPLPNQPSGSAVLAGVTCHAITIEAFADVLRSKAGGYLSGDLVDATGLTGAWDFELRWTPKLLLGRAGPDAVPLPTALEQQLGLKLEPRDVSASVLVVDAVSELPTPNPSGIAQDLPAPPPADFDVADIKISPPDLPTAGRLQAGGRLDLQGMTMKTLIRLAWTLTDDELLAGGPKWLDVTKYSLVAKSTSAIAGTEGALQIDIDDLRLMLRALLIDRFKLATHFEDRPVSAYTLVADRPKLRPADSANRTNCKEGPASGAKDPRDASPMLTRLVTCQNMTMAQFAEDLPRIAGGYLHVPVVNATGLTGAWDFTLNFTPAGQLTGVGRGGDVGSAGAAPTAVDPTGGLSLFDAVQKQLGVKLDLRKRPMPVLVIDHVEEKPSDQ
jgi:uncharacterized protein (TIGR03435 family)